MVSAKTLLASSIAIVYSFVTTEAAIAATYPSPGTIQTSGKTYDITWSMYPNLYDPERLTHEIFL